MQRKLFYGFLMFAWAGYGLYLFFAPQALTDIAGVVANSAVAEIELRAMYGGAQIAIGLAFLLPLLNPAREFNALWMQCLLLGGLGTARLLGMLISGQWDSYNLSAMAFELGTLTICMLLIRSMPPARRI